MKYEWKKIITIGISLIFLIAGTAIGSSETKILQVYSTNKDIHPAGTPPDWAMGVLNGTYGTIIHGNPSAELGKIEGYWASHVFISNRFQKGRIEGKFYENGSSVPTSTLAVLSLSIYTPTHLRTLIIGKIIEYDTNKSTRCFGIGNCWFNYTLDYKIYIHFKENLYFSGNWSLFEVIV